MAQNSGMRTYTQAEVDQIVAESVKDQDKIIKEMSDAIIEKKNIIKNLTILGGTVYFFSPCNNLIRIVDNSCCALSAIELQFLGARKDL